jgi:histidyl-tRNA synthetase
VPIEDRENMGSQKDNSVVQARVLKGFRDVLPSEALVQDDLLTVLKQVFRSFGYAPIETPHMEYTEVLIKETSGDIGKQLFRFEDQGGRDVCLRFDLTVPLARFVVQHKNELGVPFKRYAVGSVFRGERPQFGRFREFLQCDFDFLGVQSISADAEIIQVIAASFKALGLDDVTIRINNRKIMNGLAIANGVEDLTPDIIRIIDKLDKIGAEAVKAMLAEELNLKSKVISAFMDFISLSREGSPQEVLSKSRKFKSLNDMTESAFNELEDLNQVLSGLQGVSGKYRIDYSIARGLGYYTGIVYETYLNSLPEVGSVCSGGRYDNLAMNFSKKKLPGVGASVGLSRVMAAMQKLELVKNVSTPAEVLVVQMSSDDTVHTHGIAEKLRLGGLKIEVYPEPVKIKKQFQYADRKGHRFVAIMGPDEIKEGSLTIKDMKTGEQEKFLDLSQCIVRIKAGLSES